MSLLLKLRMLHNDAGRLAPDLPTEEMFLRFSEEIVDRIEGYIEEVKEASADE